MLKPRPTLLPPLPTRPHSRRPDRREPARSRAIIIVAERVAVARCGSALGVRGDDAEDGAGPGFEEGKDHGRVGDEDCDEGFADGPLSGFGGLGGTDLGDVGECVVWGEAGWKMV